MTEKEAEALADFILAVIARKEAENAPDTAQGRHQRDRARQDYDIAKSLLIEAAN